MELHHVRQGSGSSLLLIHGLGGSSRSWDSLVPALAPVRELIAVDLPGFGETPALVGDCTIAAYADALTEFISTQGLDGVDVVGSSVGARLALELARRGHVGAVVALDPGGFWNDREQRVFGASVGASVRLVRVLKPALPVLLGNPVTRTALLAQFSARPWAVPADVALPEVRGLADSASTDALLAALAHGPRQEGMPAGAARGPQVIGWGRRDLVCLPRQAARAAAMYPDARVHWFDRCGHFPHWDRPEATAELIAETTGRTG